MTKFKCQNKSKIQKLNVKTTKFFYSFVICVLIFGFISSADASNLDSIKLDFLKGNYNKVIQAGQESNDCKIRLLVALSYLKEEKFDQSMNNAQFVLKEAKNKQLREEARLIMGDIYFLKRDYQEAGNIYQEIIRDNPKTRFKEIIDLRMNKIKPVSKKTTNSTTGVNYYTIQVGAFSRIDNAKRLINKLKESGYQAYLDEVTSAKAIVFKVKVGRFSQRKQAESLGKELSHKNYPTKILP